MRFFLVDFVVPVSVFGFSDISIPVQRLGYQEVPFLYLTKPSESKPFGNLGALILSKQPPYAVKDLVFAIFRRGDGDENHFDFALPELVRHKLLI